MRFRNPFGVMVLLAVLGCSRDSLNRIPIQGSIVGASGRFGEITLKPSGATKGPAVTTQIVDGGFAFTRTDGPVPGSYEACVILKKVAQSKDVETAKGNSLADQSQGFLDFESEKRAPVTVSNDGKAKLEVKLP